MVARHSWLSWDQYYHIHLTFIDNYLGHFIVSNEIVPTVTPRVIALDGVLRCVDGLEIHVEKNLDVRYTAGRPEVRTRKYSYHVLRRVGNDVFNLFRYDNFYQHLNHPDRHHRHEYEPDGTTDKGAEPVGAEQWPTLGQVIEEVHKWWSQSPH